MQGESSMGRRRAVATITCLCGALVLAVVAGVATGANKAKLKTSSASTALPLFEDGAVSAQCKPNTKSVSGGFEASDVVTPIESLRLGSHAWRSGAVDGSSEPTSLTSFAYCRDEKVKSAADSVIVPSGEVRTATVSCPPGTKALSGGFEGKADTDSFVPPHVSRMVGKRQWETSAINYGDPDTLTAQVNCHEGKGLKTKSVSETTSALTTELIAKCKKRQRVISGGFATSDLVSKGGPFVQESRKQGKRKWVVTVFDAGSTEATAYAYCEKK
jgi:hypothetical protein